MINYEKNLLKQKEICYNYTAYRNIAKEVYGMLAIERKNAILERLQKEQRVLVAELSQEYGVTEETIRRDLDKLEKEGYVK